MSISHVQNKFPNHNLFKVLSFCFPKKGFCCIIITKIAKTKNPAKCSQGLNIKWVLRNMYLFQKKRRICFIFYNTTLKSYISDDELSMYFRVHTNSVEGLQTSTYLISVALNPLDSVARMNNLKLYIYEQSH